jgi:hypothetical protein
MVFDDKEDNNEVGKSISDFAADDITERNYAEKKYELEPIEERIVEVKKLEEDKVQEIEGVIVEIYERGLKENSIDESKAKEYEANKTEENNMKELKIEEYKSNTEEVDNNENGIIIAEENTVQEHKIEDKSEVQDTGNHEVSESKAEEIKIEINNEAEAKKEALLKLFSKPEEAVKDKPERQEIPIERIINEKLKEQTSELILVLPNTPLIPEVTELNIEEKSIHEPVDDNSKVSNEDRPIADNIDINSKVKAEEDLKLNKEEMEGDIPVIIKHSREDSSNLVKEQKVLGDERELPKEVVFSVFDGSCS